MRTPPTAATTSNSTLHNKPRTEVAMEYTDPHRSPVTHALVMGCRVLDRDVDFWAACRAFHAGGSSSLWTHSWKCMMPVIGNFNAV